MNKIFWNQVASRSIILLTNQVTIIFITFYLANKLGLETFSLLAAAMIILQLSTYFIDGGFFIPAVKEKNNSNDSFLLSKLWQEIYLLKFLIFIIFSFLIIFFNLFFNFFNDAKLLYCTLLASATYGFYPLWFFQLQNVVEKLVLPNFFGRILYIIVSVLFVDDENSLYLVMLSQAACYAIPFLCSLYFFKNNIFIKHTFYFSSLKKRFIQALPFFMGNSIFNQMHNIWGFLILAFGNFIQAGFFQIADSCLRAGQAFMSVPVDNLLIHHDKNKKFDTSLFIKILIAIIFIVICSELLLSHAVNLLFISEYSEVTSIIRVTIVLWALMALIQNLNYPSIGVLISHKIATNVFILYGLLNVPLMLYFGFYGELTALNVQIIMTSLNLVFLVAMVMFFINKKGLAK
jgi:O-antigen/teichoic acid export membrane protein